jgi:hypothetical protein
MQMQEGPLAALGQGQGQQAAAASMEQALPAHQHPQQLPPLPAGGMQHAAGGVDMQQSCVVVAPPAGQQPQATGGGLQHPVVGQKRPFEGSSQGWP